MSSGSLDHLYLSQLSNNEDLAEFAQTAANVQKVSYTSSTSSHTIMPRDYDVSPMSDQENLRPKPSECAGDFMEEYNRQGRDAQPLTDMSNGVPSSLPRGRDEIPKTPGALRDPETDLESPTQIEGSQNISTHHSRIKAVSPFQFEDTEAAEQEDSIDENNPQQGLDDDQADPSAVDDEGDSDVVEVKSASKGRPSKRLRANRDLIDTVEEAGLTRRALRTREPAQINPYSAHKLNTEKQKSGRNMTKKELNNALTRQTPPIKTIKRSAGKSKPSGRTKSRQSVDSDGRDSTPGSMTTSVVVGEQYIAENTILRLELKGNAEGEGVEKKLSEVNSLEALVDYITDRFCLAEGTTLDHLIVERPWRGKSSRLLIREGWDDQFEMFTESLAEADAWKSGRRLVVVVMMVLKDAPRKNVGITPESTFSTPISKS